jgi:hypothetical protein
LELLGIVDRERWNSITKAQKGPYDIDAPLSRYEGLHIMHFGTDDMEATRARLVKQGTPCSDIAPFQRNVDTPYGERTMYAKSLHFPHNSNPEALIQIAQHLTPELVLQPRYMRHANGAKSIVEIIVCTAEPENYVNKYKSYTGHSGEKKGNAEVINLGFSKIIIVTPEHIGEIIPNCALPALPFLAGFTVTVSNLDTTRQTLNANGITYAEHAGRIIAPAAEACGCNVIFEDEAAARY